MTTELYVPYETMKEMYIRYWKEGAGTLALARDYELPHRLVQIITGYHTLTFECGPNEPHRRCPAILFIASGQDRRASLQWQRSIS